MSDQPTFIIQTDYPAADLLADWQWLVEGEYEMTIITSMGVGFFKRVADGEIYLLDTLSGEFKRVAADVDELQRLIKQPDNRSAWFMPDVVIGQHALGMSPGHNQCYSFEVPPVLGGKLDPENIETCDVAVHFSIAGQIFRQVRDLPPGTRIDKIELTDRFEKKPWWRFW